MEIDKLKLYRGNPYIVNEHIQIHMPTLGEIVDYGEQDFYSMCFTIVEQPTNMKWQLWDVGVDWTEINQWNFFTEILAPSLTKEKTRILFGDIVDFSLMKKVYKKEIDSYVLVQDVAIFDEDSQDVGGAYYDGKSKKGLFRKKEKPNSNKKQPYEYQIIVDEYTYKMICKIIRDTYGFEEKHDRPANEVTKLAQIEDEKEEYMMNKDKPYVSNLMNLISAMVNSEGFKRDDVTVFDMNIYAFMDSVKRVSKIKNAQLLLQSGYSGFGIDIKDIDKKEIEWAGDL